MTFRSSTYKVAKTCWLKAFRQFHMHLGAPRSTPLLDGGALHKGIAEGLVSKDWTGAAIKAAMDQFDIDAQEVPLLAEQTYLVEDHKALVLAMLQEFVKLYEKEDYTIIQPECHFVVDLPGSMHNCVWQHWKDDKGVEYWSEPPAEMIKSRLVRPAHPTGDPICKCWQPHRLEGTTDAIIAWHNVIWFTDHKTTAIDGTQFWDQWHLDFQMTAYTYGIWKALGIKPKGFIINAIFKPSDKQVSNWNSKRKNGPNKEVKDYLSHGREAFMRSDEDLQRFEQEAIDFANEWEWRIVNGVFGMSPITHSCLSYNRRCDYYQMCLTHDEDQSGLIQLEGR